MILGFFTLLIAMAISGVAAYYSILGLVAIFAAAALPVIIMGSVLEAGKIMTAIWLHRNWDRANLAYKLYLVPSVIFLMLLTSLSVFGFLSKAHLDQAVPTSDVAAQIELVDTKIVTQRENINAARKVLTQMDGAVDAVLSRSNNEQGARNANNLRNQQAKDRTKLQDDIGKAQTEIAKLNEERAAIARDLRKIEAEVGPVKYVAALIYGDNPDANLLERSVRWVIILIVAVFDPLAIVLILAGTKQMQWGMEAWRARRVEKAKPFQDARMIAELHEMVNKLTEENEQFYTQNQQLLKLEQDYKDTTVELMHISLRVGELTEENELLSTQKENLLQDLLQRYPDALQDARSKIDELTEQLAAQPAQHTTPPDTEAMERQAAAIAQLTQEYTNVEAHYSRVLGQLQQANQDNEIQATLLATALQRGQDADEQRHHAYTVLEQRDQELAQLKVDRDALVAHINELASTPTGPAYAPDDGPLTDQQVHQIRELAAADLPQGEPILVSSMFDPQINPDAVAPAPPRTDFGSEFPHSPGKGDMFLRTDFKPSRLFKWNEQTWILINKNTTDAYAYNEMYVAFLVQKLQDREYEWDDLSATEQQQVSAVMGGPIV
jgi:septal ring factor EnvC (AmiA/AmiB activator)